MELYDDEGTAPLPTDFGGWTKTVWADRTRGVHHDCLCYGDIARQPFTADEEVAVYVHVGDKYQEILQQEGDSHAQLKWAMKMIDSAKRGVVIYLDEEAQGGGAVSGMEQLNQQYQWVDGKIQANADYQAPDNVDYSVAVAGLKNMGLKKIKLVGYLGQPPGKLKGALMMAGFQVT
jgi:GTP cyclohydrolase II